MIYQIDRKALQCRKGLFLYSVSARQRIPENADLGRHEGEEGEEGGDRYEKAEREPRGKTRPLRFSEKPCLEKVCRRRTNKENDDIDKVGGFSQGAVVGIKKNRDQENAEEDAA